MVRKSSRTPPEAIAEETAVTTEAESASPTVRASEASSQEAPGQTAMQMVGSASAETAEPEAGEATDEASVAQVIPAIGKYLGKAAYGTFYYASYGVVYAALTASQLIPMDNLMGRAIKEGAEAARGALATSKKSAVAEEATPGDSVPANA